MAVANPMGKKSELSPLMQAKLKASLGSVVNFCPYGCEVGELDDNGYCYHLVGFTTDGVFYEPLRLKLNGERFTDGTMKQRVRASDKVIQITVSHRVYRKDAVREILEVPETKRDE